MALLHKLRCGRTAPLASALKRPVIGAFYPAGQWHSPSRSGGGRSILWERRQPACEEVTIGPVEGFPNLLSQLGRGADVHMFTNPTGIFINPATCASTIAGTSRGRRQAPPPGAGPAVGV
jgi:hypothetical protein